MNNVVVTSGGTTEYIDEVRKITNSGTGRLGAEIADRLASENKVYYIHTKGAVMPNIFDKNIHSIEVISVDDLQREVKKVLTDHHIDWFVHTMAVSDYSVDYVSSAEGLFDYLSSNGLSVENIINNANRYNVDEKISSKEENLIIKLKKTPKIINMIKDISPDTHLIGFKLLVDVSTEELVATARKLQDATKADYIVANDLKSIKGGVHESFIVNEKSSFYVKGKTSIALNIKRIIRDGE